MMNGTAGDHNMEGEFDAGQGPRCNECLLNGMGGQDGLPSVQNRGRMCDKICDMCHGMPEDGTPSQEDCMRDMCMGCWNALFDDGLHLCGPEGVVDAGACQDPREMMDMEEALRGDGNDGHGMEDGHHDDMPCGDVCEGIFNDMENWDWSMCD